MQIKARFMPYPKTSTRLFLRSSSIVRYRAKARLPSQSLLANTFGVRVHDFTSDVSTKVTTTSYNSTTFNWQDTDKIGVFPLTVDDRQETTQLGCTLQSKDAVRYHRGMCIPAEWARLCLRSECCGFFSAILSS